MPALLTHDFQGRDLLRALGGNPLRKDEHDAFLLGCQGPDPLFFLGTDPRYWQRKTWKLGSLMHNERTGRLLYELSQSLGMLSVEEAPIGRAYAHGFLSHYSLDRTAHPLIYAMEYRICDAGVEGLSRENKDEVHHLIESELDEMLLYRRTGGTVREIKPLNHALVAGDGVLGVVGKMYVYLALATYGETIDGQAFARAVRAYRRVERLLYSPSGAKRNVLGGIEEVVRPYSIVRAMARRPIRLETTWYANPQHLDWENPFTGELSRDSFDDLYAQALEESRRFIAVFDAPGFNEAGAGRLTGGLNFSGDVPDDAYREGSAS